jgi:hypothetical protein
MYGVAILIAYFIKWPIFLGLPFLAYRGMDINIVLGLIWVLCLGLVIKDFYSLIKKRIDNKE